MPLSYSFSRVRGFSHGIVEDAPAIESLPALLKHSINDATKPGFTCTASSHLAVESRPLSPMRGPHTRMTPRSARADEATDRIPQRAQIPHCTYPHNITRPNPVT